jgi:DME family drug/metabolite transporter
VLAFAEPMVATLVGIFVLHEPITLPAVLGIALIFAGIVVLNRRSS